MAPAVPPSEPSSQQLPQPSTPSSDIVLTQAQAERLIRLEEALTEIRISNLAALRSTELFANDINTFLVKEDRPPGVQALLEKQAELMLMTYADSLTKRLQERNVGLLADALTSRPEPVVTHTVVYEPRPRIEVPQAVKTLAGCLIQIAIMVVAWLFVVGAFLSKTGPNDSAFGAGCLTPLILIGALWLALKVKL